MASGLNLRINYEIVEDSYNRLDGQKMVKGAQYNKTFNNRLGKI